MREIKSRIINVIKTKTLYFEYTRSAITKEFKSGSAAKWGGIRIGFTF